MNIFGSINILLIMTSFGGSSQNWTGFMGHFYAFYALFLRSMYRMGISVLGVANFQIFVWVCLIFQIFFGVSNRCWVQTCV